MKKEIFALGKDAEVAVNNAVLALGASSIDEITYTIEDLGSKGIFGIGARPTKVRAWIEIPDEESQKSFSRSAAPQGEKSERTHSGKSKRNHGKRDGMRPPRDFVPPAEPSKPKEVVIPESELKMEPVSAVPGEDLAFDFVKQLVEGMGLSATVSLFHCEDNSRRIVIAGEGASALIGHHGEALDALQYLANLASAKKNANGERNHRRVTIDIEGYRAKREETLRALARRMAEKALRTHRNVMLEPMSAYERRIIHSEIQNMEGVATNSIGADSNRKIVIYLTDKKGASQADTEKDEDEADDFTAEAVEEAADASSENA